MNDEAMPAAYLLDAQWSDEVDLLVRQGVVVERLTAPWSGRTRRFTADSVIYATRPFEGHRATRLEGSWGDEAADSLPAGGYLIPTDQRYGLLAALLLPLVAALHRDERVRGIRAALLRVDERVVDAAEQDPVFVGLQLVGRVLGVVARSVG